MLPLMNDNAATFLQYFGLGVIALKTLKYALTLCNNFRTFVLSSGEIDFKKYGSWAIVTGCTDGIGKAYAEQLAKRGLNIVLISRTQAKLEEQSKELIEKYSIKTKIIAADFTEQDSIYSRINQELEGLDIGLLFNNVGMNIAVDFYHKLVNIDDSNVLKPLNDIINCNITSVTKMTSIVLPGMIERKGGIIVNNASIAARFPFSFLTTYAASKAFVDFFSRGLNDEYKNKGIIVQSLCPGLVSTKLSKSDLSTLSPDPVKYARNAIKTIGTQPVTCGYFPHNLLGWFITTAPEWFINYNREEKVKAYNERTKTKQQ